MGSARPRSRYCHLMPWPHVPDSLPGGRRVAVGVRAAYDAVARAYDDQLGDELAGKPLDRAVLQAVTELAGAGIIADVGCGPGHVTRFLAARHARVIGVDISPAMIGVARGHAPALAFAVGSMLQLPAADGAWSAVIALYSIIHLTAGDRAVACREFALALRPGGWLLAAFHIDSPDFAAGEVNHLTAWFGQAARSDRGPDLGHRPPAGWSSWPTRRISARTACALRTGDGTSPPPRRTPTGPTPGCAAPANAPTSSSRHAHLAQAPLLPLARRAAGQGDPRPSGSRNPRMKNVHSYALAWYAADGSGGVNPALPFVGPEAGTDYPITRGTAHAITCLFAPKSLPEMICGRATGILEHFAHRAPLLQHSAAYRRIFPGGHWRHR